MKKGAVLPMSLRCCRMIEFRVVGYFSVLERKDIFFWGEHFRLISYSVIENLSAGSQLLCRLKYFLCKLLLDALRMNRPRKVVDFNRVVRKFSKYYIFNIIENVIFVLFIIVIYLLLENYL